MPFFTLRSQGDDSMKIRFPKASAMVAHLAVFCVVSCAVASAQSQHQVHAATLAVAINGADSPNLIPDDMATRHLLLALAAQRARRADGATVSGLIDSLAIGDGDAAAMVAAIDALVPQLRAVDESLASLAQSAPAGGAAAEELNAARFRALDATKQLIERTMSADGWASVREFVDKKVKPRIVIYGQAPRVP